MPLILIVEDEPSIAQSLDYVLQADGFTCHCVSLASEALDYMRQHLVDLMILDIGLPDTSGFEVCKQVRSASEVPIIFLTARSEEIDRVVGLEIGADDYVTKPFSPREVAARVRTILKRSAAGQTQAAAFSGAQVLQHQTLQCKFYYCGKPLTLTKAEYRLLAALHAAPDIVFSRDQLLEVLGVNLGANYERTIDTHIKSIRAKLRAINAKHSPIKTDRGFGYRLSWAPV